MVRVSGFRWRNAIETHASVEFWDLHTSNNGECPAHAETHNGYMPSTSFQILGSPAYILFSGAYPVKSGHEMIGFVWLLASLAHDTDPVLVR